MAQIKTYCRIKPTKNISRFYDWDKDRVCIGVKPAGWSRDNDSDRNTITHDTEFTHVFGPTVSQSEVFDVVASNIVEGCLAGYNGTIFAYGQTGSGKTYTIEGGSKTYADRGMAPRALSAVYQCIQNTKASNITIHVSYLEIYQETGYDLLNPTARMSGIVAHLPKVSVRDGPGNTCIIRNLSTHLAADETIAQNLLHQGRVSRRVAETPMNHRSSRSHAIFTIYLTCQDRETDVIRKSKLHLVDLAGSERAAKSGIKGNQLIEAKSINLSLHHLEGVIIALQKMARKDRRQRSHSAGPFRQKRITSASSTRSLPYSRRSTGEITSHRHVPYRNSLLTMILKDSLGGNCLTAMVATLSVEDINIGESLSTCRFAQRVACIKNHASRNEEVDDKILIKRLRKRILELEHEIMNLKQGKQSFSGDTKVVDSLCAECKQKHATDSEVSQNATVDSPTVDRVVNRENRKLCVKVMHGFIGGKINDPVSSGINNVTNFRICLKLLREMLMRSYAVSQTSKGKRMEVEHPNLKSVEKIKIRSRSSPSLLVADVKKKECYTSPFEKKREKAIEKAGARVERKHSDQKLQTKNLLEFQTNIREQQLTLLQKEMNGKVLNLKCQVARQHTLIHNLNEGLGDAEEIHMEQTVLKQLIKRLSRYENRLQIVSEQLKIIDQHNQLQHKAGSYTTKADSTEVRKNKPTPAENESIMFSDSKNPECSKEKPSNKSHGNGVKVNTRKVLELLKAEEKKQEKIQSALDGVRFEAINDHLALKEQATRQKLQEFKEKLRQSKERAAKINVSDSIVATSSDHLTSNDLTSNDQLTSSNDQLTSSNDHLTSSNDHLMSSNHVTPVPSFDQSTDLFLKDGISKRTHSPDYWSSKTSFDSALDSMLQGSNIRTPVSAKFSTEKVSSPNPLIKSKSSVNESMRATENSSKKEPFIKKSGDYSDLRQKLSKYLGTGQTSTPKIRPAMMSVTGVRNGDVYSSTSIPMFENGSQDISTVYNTRSPLKSMYVKGQESQTTLDSFENLSSGRKSPSDFNKKYHNFIGKASFQSPDFFEKANIAVGVERSPFKESSQHTLSTISLQSSEFYGSEINYFKRGNPSPESTSNFEFSSTASLQTYQSTESVVLPKNENDALIFPGNENSFPTTFLPSPNHSSSLMEDKEREVFFIKAVKENKTRVKKIRQAQKAAGIIQKAWKSYKMKKYERSGNGY